MGRRAKNANRQSKVDTKGKANVETSGELQMLKKPEMDEHSAPYTLSDLRADCNLWYRICVLIHDLHNVAKDHNSEQRIVGTVDALYLSTPYFSLDEAARIKATIVEPTFEQFVHDDPEDGGSPPVTGKMGLEDAITSSLTNFFEKRRASGDARPCGPHTLAPIYQRVFGVERADIEDERFLSRLRRSGLGVQEAGSASNT